MGMSVKITQRTIEVLQKLKSEQGINHNKAIELAVLEKYGKVGKDVSVSQQEHTENK